MPTKTFFARGAHGKANARADASNFWRALLRQGVRRADMDGFTYADGSIEVSWVAPTAVKFVCTQAESWAALEAAEERRVASEQREMVGNQVERAEREQTRTLVRQERRVVTGDYRHASTVARQRAGKVKREGANWVVTFWEANLG